VVNGGYRANGAFIRLQGNDAQFAGIELAIPFAQGKKHLVVSLTL
jgi:hypothetical protein